MNNNMPECSKCHSFKLSECDYGGAPKVSNRADPQAFTNSSVAKRDEATIRNLADSYGMTDISNKGGRAAKGAPAPAQGKYGVKDYFGVPCPIGDSPVTVSGGTTIPIGAQPGVKFAGQGAVPGRIADMSQVVAEHKG